jgi:hypothetical protein
MKVLILSVLLAVALGDVLELSQFVPVEELPWFWEGRDVVGVLKGDAVNVRSRRIVNGEEAFPHMYPYQVW